MANFTEKELSSVRQSKGLYNIKELAKMFGIGRAKIDYALNTNQLKYVSPNGKTRFIFVDDFFEYLKVANLKTKTAEQTQSAGGTNGKPI